MAELQVCNNVSVRSTVLHHPPCRRRSTIAKTRYLYLPYLKYWLMILHPHPLLYILPCTIQPFHLISYFLMNWSIRACGLQSVYIQQITPMIYDSTASDYVMVSHPSSWIGIKHKHSVANGHWQESKVLRRQAYLVLCTLYSLPIPGK